MFLKTALTFIVVGVLSVNALTVPVARSPAPEPESQELDAWMLKRDRSYDLFSRELQALDELFSREPENWADQLVARQTPGSRLPGGITATPWQPSGGWGSGRPGVTNTPTSPSSPPGYTPSSPGARPGSPPLNLGPVYGTGGVTIPLRQPR